MLRDRESSITQREVRDAIMESTPSEWEQFDGHFGTLKAHEDDPFPRSVWTYDYDVNLRIEQGSDLNDNFQADWTDAFIKDNNTQVEYYVFYGSSPVCYCSLVSVEGGKAILPVPDRPHDEEERPISRFKDDLARIVNVSEREYETHKDRANIVVKG